MENLVKPNLSAREVFASKTVLRAATKERGAHPCSMVRPRTDGSCEVIQDD
jgi:hypothetical protein